MIYLLVSLLVCLFVFLGCYSFSSASIRSSHSRCFLAVHGNYSERLPVSDNCLVAFHCTFLENVVV